MRQSKNLQSLHFRSFSASAKEQVMNDGVATILELPVPKSKGTVLGAVVVTAFILSFSSLAIYNLFNWTGVLPSTLWLLLVGSVVVGTIKSKGLKQSAIELLGVFSLGEFVQAIRLTSGQVEVQFGYQLFGRRFVHFNIAVEKIEHVKWSTGQASHRAGRDVNDWSVAVWYDHGDPVKSERNRKSESERYR